MKYQVSILALLGIMVVLTQPVWSMGEDDDYHPKFKDGKKNARKKTRAKRRRATIDNGEKKTKTKARKTSKTRPPSRRRKKTPEISSEDQEAEAVSILAAFQKGPLGLIQTSTEEFTDSTPIAQIDPIIDSEMGEEVYPLLHSSKKTAGQEDNGQESRIPKWYRDEVQDPIDNAKEKLLDMVKKEDADAQNFLGVCYSCGRDGFPKDYELAVKFWKNASDQGHSAAKWNLEHWYDNVTQNLLGDLKRAEETRKKLQANLGQYTPTSSLHAQIPQSQPQQGMQRPSVPLRGNVGRTATQNPGFVSLRQLSQKEIPLASYYCRLAAVQGNPIAQKNLPRVKALEGQNSKNVVRQVTPPSLLQARGGSAPHAVQQEALEMQRQLLAQHSLSLPENPTAIFSSKVLCGSDVVILSDEQFQKLKKEVYRAYMLDKEKLKLFYPQRKDSQRDLDFRYTKNKEILDSKVIEQLRQQFNPKKFPDSHPPSQEK